MYTGWWLCVCWTSSCPRKGTPEKGCWRDHPLLLSTDPWHLRDTHFTGIGVFPELPYRTPWRQLRIHHPNGAVASLSALLWQNIATTAALMIWWCQTVRMFSNLPLLKERVGGNILERHRNSWSLVEVTILSKLFAQSGCKDNKSATQSSSVYFFVSSNAHRLELLLSNYCVCYFLGCTVEPGELDDKLRNGLVL